MKEDYNHLNISSMTRCWSLGPQSECVTLGSESGAGAASVTPKLVEGCQVYTESGTGDRPGSRRNKEAGEGGGQRISAEIGHTDWVTDMILCQSQQTLLVSASNDGVMKIWK